MQDIVIKSNEKLCQFSMFDWVDLALQKYNSTVSISIVDCIYLKYNMTFFFDRMLNSNIICIASQYIYAFRWSIETFTWISFSVVNVIDHTGECDCFRLILLLFSSFFYESVGYEYMCDVCRYVYEYGSVIIIGVIIEFLILMELIVCISLCFTWMRFFHFVDFIYAWFPSLIYVQNKRKHYADDVNNDDSEDNGKNNKSKPHWCVMEFSVKLNERPHP